MSNSNNERPNDTFMVEVGVHGFGLPGEASYARPTRSEIEYAAQLVGMSVGEWIDRLIMMELNRLAAMLDRNGGLSDHVEGHETENMLTDLGLFELVDNGTDLAEDNPALNEARIAHLKEIGRSE